MEKQQTAVQQVSNLALSFAFTPMQWSILGICTLLLFVSLYKWLAKRPTGAFECLAVGSIPVLLYVANFLSLPSVN
jgi:hypothetical protein